MATADPHSRAGPGAGTPAAPVRAIQAQTRVWLTTPRRLVPRLKTSRGFPCAPWDPGSVPESACSVSQQNHSRVRPQQRVSVWSLRTPQNVPGGPAGEDRDAGGSHPSVHPSGADASAVTVTFAPSDGQSSENKHAAWVTLTDIRLSEKSDRK